MNSVDVKQSIDMLEQVLRGWRSESSIKPTLVHATGPNWILTLTEEWPDDLNHGSTHLLDDCVEWATEKLQPNSKCTRIAWNIWNFKTKKEAEKFLTMFYLSWT